MSLEYARKKNYKNKKLERPIYIKNVDSTLNYKGLIKNTVNMELFYKRYKKRMEIDIIRD